MENVINLNNLNVDDSGRVTFSGLQSGIDIQGTVDAIIAARRIPVDTLEAAIGERQLKIDAYGQLSSLMSLLNESVDSLRGAVSFGNAGNIYETKQAFVTGSRLDGGSASDPANLLGVSVTNAALTGSHSLEVLQTALAHKVASGDFTSLTDDLGTASGGAAGSISGNFTLNGVQIDVFATDSLKDLRDRINNANSGANATGVSASIVSVNASEHVLVLTTDETGSDMVLADPGSTGVLASLGLSGDGGSSFANELQASRKAQFHADGLLDSSNTRYETALQDSAATTLSSAGTLSFSTGDAIAYSATDTLQDLADAITAGVTGVTAQVVQDGAKVRLELTGASAFTFSETGGGSAIDDLGLGNARLLIERDSNVIDDLFEGVTLSLFQAEPGTTMTIEVAQDLNAMKTALVGFVEAYNAVKVFINQQQQADPATGTADENAGALFGDGALGTIEQNLARILGQGATGVDESFSVLAQIGIDFVDNGTLSDPLRIDTLQIDDSVLDDALLNNPAEVRRLLSFDFTSSDPNVVLLNFDGATTYSAAGYTLNVAASGGVVTSANINGSADGADDGSVTINGNVLTVTDASGAEGLQVLYTGSASASGIQLDYTKGIAANLFFEIENIIDSQTGTIQSEVDAMSGQNELAQERIDQMLQRLDVQRENLLQRFIAMEQAISQMQTILDNLRQTMDAMLQDNG